MTTAAQLDLPPSWSATRARAARDWYLKGLTATADADRFMLFWVSMEVIFNGSSVKVMGTPECSNGHPQAEMECPECGEPYLRMVRGESIQRFLTATCGVSSEDAHLLWRMRQMFHGEVSFDSPKLMVLPRLTVLLQSVTLALVKHSSGLPDDGPPVIFPGGPTISAVALGMSREVRPSDLAG